MKKFYDRYLLVIAFLVAIGSIAFTALTFKVTAVTIDIGFDWLYRQQYNEATVKTDAMTDQYNEDLARTKSMENSTDFVERTVASLPWWVHVPVYMLLMYFQLIIFKMYYEFIKEIAYRHQIMRVRQ